MRRLIVLAALGLSLSACGGSDTDPDAPKPHPDTASNFAQPIDARGGDPAWGLKIRGQQLTLNRPNQPDLVATAPGAVIDPHSAAWTATLPSGQTMKVSVYASACADAASGTSYPFSVEVLLPDAAPLNGCATHPAPAAVAKR
jgi:uncharacterized membrane protein